MHRDSITNFNESLTYEENWRGSNGNFQPISANQDNLILGPGQKRPPYPLTYSKFGDLFLEFKTSRSLVEMRVSLLNFFSYSL